MNGVTVTGLKGDAKRRQCLLRIVGLGSVKRKQFRQLLGLTPPRVPRRRHGASEQDQLTDEPETEP